MIVQPLEDRGENSVEDQEVIWSRVVMLLYLVTHSRPHIANMTQELLKVNDGANFAVFCELLGVIKFVLGTEKFGLKLETFRDASNPWEIVLSNSNYAGDLISRRSIHGFIFCVLGVPVSW